MAPVMGWRLARAGLLCALAGPCLAGGNLVLIDTVPEHDHLALGWSAWAWPRSPDSPHSPPQWWPALDWYGHDGVFASTENGLGINLSRNPDLACGVRLWPQWGRAHEDATPGASAIGPRLQAQVFANRTLWGVVQAQTATAVGAGRQRDGLQSEWGLLTGVPWDGGALGVGVSLNWANRAYRRDMLGVPHAGWADANATLSFDQKLDARWHVDGQWLRTRLTASGRWTHAAVLSLWRDW